MALVKKLKPLILILIFISILLSAWYVLNNDLVFHTDIARDFLVMEDMVKNHKLTLIGPRSGGIAGVFHGPLWFYLNLPIFMIGKGNPVVVGWFWILLSVISIAVTYFFGKKLFNKEIVLLSSLIWSIYLINIPNQLSNPFGAVILFPVFFYLFRKYLKTLRVIFLVSALFCLGLIIQFQIAFGGPILILTTICLIPFLIKRKKAIHLFSYLILLIPLASYFLFELRHDFIQIRSVISYMQTKQKEDINFFRIILLRIKGLLFDGLNITSLKNELFALPITLLFGFLFYKAKTKKIKYQDNYLLFFYFYIGFWILTCAYKSLIQIYYYQPFFPLIILILISSFKLIDKKIFLAILIYVFATNIYAKSQTIGRIALGWKAYSAIAKSVYQDAKNQPFGYYIFTPDQFSYSEKYAMNYAQKKFSQTQGFAYEKKNLTYLIIAPAPDEKPWLNSIWWKSHQVKIYRKPDQTYNYPNNFRVEKYFLSPEEMQVASDPNLIHDLTFR